MVWSVVAGLVVLLVAPMPVASAQDGEVPLAQGTWLGTMGAGGVLTAQTADLDAIWSGWIDGSFSFSVAGGQAAGTWDWYGLADVTAMTPQGQVQIDLQSSALGPITGSSSRMTMTGQQTTTGQGSAMGMSTSIGPVPNPVDPVEVVFVDSSCNVAYGDWTTSMNEIANEYGLQGSLAGFFIATNVAPSPDSIIGLDIAQRFEDLHGRALDGISGITSNFSTGTLLDYMALIQEAAALEAEADRLEGSCVFDPADGGPFATSLTSLLASVLRSVIPTIDAAALFNATQLLLATGAIGEGASPVTADLVEPLLAERAQTLVDQAVSTDGGVHDDGEPCSAAAPCMLYDDNLILVFVAADSLGVQLTAGGVPLGYADLLVGR